MPELLGCEPRHCRVGRALLRAAPCGPPSGHHVDPATPADGMVFSSGCRGPQAPVAPRGTRPGSESVGPFCWPQWRPPGCELLPCVQTPDSVSLPAHLLSCQSISSPRPDIHPQGPPGPQLAGPASLRQEPGSCRQSAGRSGPEDTPRRSQCGPAHRSPGDLHSASHASEPGGGSEWVVWSVRVPGRQCGSGEPLEGVWRTEGWLCGQMPRGEDETRTDRVTAADSEPATPEPLTPAESGLTPQGLDPGAASAACHFPGGPEPPTVLPQPRLRKRPSWATILVTVRMLHP